MPLASVCVGRVADPQARIAVGLQLHADCSRLRTLGILLRLVQAAQDVLHVVTEFVGHHILLGQRAAGGTKAGHQFIEKAGVEIGFDICRAVEGSYCCGCRAAAGIGRGIEDDRSRAGVLHVVLGKVVRPESIEAVHRAGDPAVQPFVCVGSGLAFLDASGSGAATIDGGWLAAAPGQVSEDVGIDTEECQQQHHDAAANATTDLGAAAHAAATSVFHLRGVKLRAVIETHTVRIDVTFGAWCRTLP